MADKPTGQNVQILADPAPAPGERADLAENEFEFTHGAHVHRVKLNAITDEQAETLRQWDVAKQREVLLNVITSRSSEPPRAEGLNQAEANVVASELLRRHEQARLRRLGVS